MPSLALRSSGFATFDAFDQLQEPLIDKLRQIVERLTPELGTEQTGLIFGTFDQLQETLIDKLRLVKRLIPELGIEKSYF